MKQAMQWISLVVFFGFSGLAHAYDQPLLTGVMSISADGSGEYRGAYAGTTAVAGLYRDESGQEIVKVRVDSLNLSLRFKVVKVQNYLVKKIRVIKAVSEDGARLVLRDETACETDACWGQNFILSIEKTSGETRSRLSLMGDATVHSFGVIAD